MLVLNAPLRLQPAVVQKPWGREIRFTGARAHGCVGSSGHSLPLAHLLAAAPQYLCRSRERELVPLKVLDPHPDAALGDLYCELHNTKREVYIVTHVDQRAWPDGRGAIRFGVNQKLRRSPGGEQGFRAAYLAAVRDYEAVRRQIDALLDVRRAAEAIAMDAPVPPEVTLQWLAGVPKELRDAEETLRVAMQRCTQLRRLDVGDVVTVPVLTPHALQHGVRVVELHTRGCERQIVSFTQKVLTQPQWDSAAAIATMRLDAPRTQLQLLRETRDARIERIADFAEFELQRIRLARGAAVALPEAPYALCLGLDGTTSVGAVALTLEQACFVPHAALQGGASPAAHVDSDAGRLHLRNHEEEDAVCLLVLPK